MIKTQLNTLDLWPAPAIAMGLMKYCLYSFLLYTKTCVCALYDSKASLLGTLYGRHSTKKNEINYRHTALYGKWYAHKTRRLRHHLL